MLAANGHRLVVIAGERCGSGSSRDWAAKAPALLGVNAVLARSFERIHRSNLIGMGILLIELPTEAHPKCLQLDPSTRVELDVDPSTITEHPDVPLAIICGGTRLSFTARALIETRQEPELIRHGGVLPFMLHRSLATERE